MRFVGAMLPRFLEMEDILRIQVAHDYLTQTGGAERVALAMLEGFGSPSIITSLYQSAGTFPGFQAHVVETSGLQRVTWLRRDPRLALPFLARAWDHLRVCEDVDVVLASSSGWAHGIAAPSGVSKVVYCHNPARWLYQPEDYLKGRMTTRSFANLFSRLKDWDQRAAESTDAYIANSSIVQERIMRIYGRESVIIHPPVLLQPDEPQRKPENAPASGFFLTVARAKGYKNTKLLEDAFRGSARTLVVVGAAEVVRLNDDGSIVRLGRVSDAELRWLYRRATALVGVSREDFGLTPIEAFRFGTPAITLRRGGYLDSMIEGVTGVFVEAESRQAIMNALEEFEARVFVASEIVRHSERFSLENFLRSVTAVAAASTSRTF